MKPSLIAAGIVLLVLAGLYAVSDWSQPWSVSQPGEAPTSKLPPLHNLDGTLQGGGVWVEDDGPYPAQLPSVILRGATTYKRDAYRVARLAAEKHLAAPGSAVFAPFELAQIGSDDDMASVAIDAYVDAQSAGGVFGRATLYARLDRSKAGGWIVKELRLTTSVPGQETMLVPTRTAPV